MEQVERRRYYRAKRQEDQKTGEEYCGTAREDLPLNYLNAQTIERYYISAISEMELNSIQCAVSYISELDAAINIHLFILFIYLFIYLQCDIF